jgi:uncharacterized repeat protein (TIGR02543 family)
MEYRWFYGMGSQEAIGTNVISTERIIPIPPDLQEGRHYFRIEVSALDPIANRILRESRVIRVIVGPPVEVRPPIPPLPPETGPDINIDPALPRNVVVTEGRITGNLYVNTAEFPITTSPAGLALSYQWFYRHEASNTSARIPNAIGPIFPIPTTLTADRDAAGNPIPRIYYFYAVVSTGGGSQVSRVARVTVMPDGFFPLTVVGSRAADTGAGNFRAGTQVEIRAGDWPGVRFERWESDPPGVVFSNANDPNTHIIMPAHPVVVTAIWEGGRPPEDQFNVTIVNNPGGAVSGQQGSGFYSPGATVNLVAGTRAGYDFVNWTTSSPGVTINNADNASASFTMPNNNVTVTANWVAIGMYAVTVSGSQLPAGTGANQSGAGNYNPGDSVTIRAGTRTGYTFSNWTVMAGGVTLANINSATTTFTMPANNVTVTANWTATAEGAHTLTIRARRGGTVAIGSGSHSDTVTARFDAGTQVTISARPERDYRFDEWSYGHGETFNRRREETTFIMPDQDVTIWAEFIHRDDIDDGRDWNWDQWPDAPPIEPPQGPPAAPRPEPGPAPLPSAPGGQMPGPVTGPTVMPDPVAPAPVVTPLSVNLNGRPLNFSGQSAATINGIALIPVEELFRILGYTVETNAANGTATMSRGNVVVVITEGSRNFTVSGINRNLRAPVLNYDGYLMASFVEIIEGVGGRTHLDANGVINIYITR